MCAPETRCDAVCLPRSDAAQRVEVRAPQLRADLVKVSLRAQARRPYRLLDFCASRMMRFTSESDTPNVRAMVAGFSPASNDARMRFALPSGISATLVVATGEGTGRDALDAKPSSLLASRFRLPISASTATCSRCSSASSRYRSEVAISLGRANCGGLVGRSAVDVNRVGDDSFRLADEDVVFRVPMRCRPTC